MRTLLLVTLIAGQAPRTAAPITFETLSNLTYRLSEGDDRRVALKGGTWTDPEDGGSSFQILTEHAIGDLDGDKVPDAVSLLVENGGGSGRFYAMFVFVSRNGMPEQLEPPELLGDRSTIQRVTIDRRGTIAVRFVTHRDSDPACCPTLKVENKYRVVNGRLVPQF